MFDDGYNGLYVTFNITIYLIIHVYNRTRMLDAWTKDLISSYQYMNDKERILVRSFLNLDLSVQKDIYLQDKMANGMVEAPRASAAGLANPPPTTTRNMSSGKSDSGSSKVSGAVSREDATSQVCASPLLQRAYINCI
jgi:hypothetical protein